MVRIAKANKGVAQVSENCQKCIGNATNEIETSDPSEGNATYMCCMATTTPAPIASDFMTVTELAAYLSVTKSTVYHWNHTGEGPTRCYAGRHVRYWRQDVIDWLLSSRDEK